MRIEQSGAEDRLRDALQTKATEAAAGLTFEDIRRSAAASQRHTRRRATVVVVAAAAAMVVAAVPTAVLLHADDTSPTPPLGTPTATPSGPTTPTTSPTPDPRPQAGAHFLRRLPESADPSITYLFGTTIHLASGGTTPLPGPSEVAAIAAYHGGWLVGDGVMPGIRWYDNTGALKLTGVGAYQIAVSPDGMRIAFQYESKIHIGIASGMGEGEQIVPVSNSVDASPAGFLRGGALVYTDAGHVRTDQPISASVPTTMVQADAVSADDLVAGEDGARRGMVWSARTGKTLWSASEWVVSAFSADGRYAAATSNRADGTSGLAILDAQTGEVLSHHDFGADEIVGAYGAVFDRDGSVLLSVADGQENRAVLRLTPDGKLTRATPVLPNDLQRDPLNVVFAAGP